MSLDLSPRDEALLAGREGEGAALAMRVLLRIAETMGAARLLDITSAHVDGCLSHGKAGLDFAVALVDGGARVTVPTTLNVGSLDLLHPELNRSDAETTRQARELMDAYVALGCRPTWTCAPYQLDYRPGFGEQVAWGESNAIIFANSVLGARTERYGDFVDICAAVTGRAPAAGLHLEENRKATMVVSVGSVADLAGEDVFYPLLGLVLGHVAGSRVVAITGLPPDVNEDRLKALGAAAASSGSVALFHAVGVTPEAPDLEAVLADGRIRDVTVTRAMLEAARADLSTAADGQIDAVSVGTPHYSPAELRTLAGMLGGGELAVPLYVSTNRAALTTAAAAIRALETAGAIVVADTCTYVTSILDPSVRRVMTDSAKWAYYAPANLGVDVVFGSQRACAEAALTGRMGETW